MLIEIAIKHNTKPDDFIWKIKRQIITLSSSLSPKKQTYNTMKSVTEELKELFRKPQAATAIISLSSGGL